MTRRNAHTTLENEYEISGVMVMTIFSIAINAVFKRLDRHISHGETVQVRNSMKRSLRQLWPAD